MQTLAPVNGARGGAWAPDGTILFALVSGPIFRVPAAGGVPPAPLTKLLPRQSSHRFPRFLSDGRHFPYFGQAGSTICAASTWRRSTSPKACG